MQEVTHACMWRGDEIELMIGNKASSTNRSR